MHARSVLFLLLIHISKCHLYLSLGFSTYTEKQWMLDKLPPTALDCGESDVSWLRTLCYNRHVGKDREGNRLGHLLES